MRMIHRTMLAAVLAMVAARSAAAQADTAACDRTTLGRVLVMDTAAMTRRAYEGPFSQVTDGVQMDAYSDAGGVRVVRAYAYGESRRWVLTYWLTTPENYVAESEELIYDHPYYEGEVTVVSRVRAVAYVCGGRPLAEEGTELLDPAALRELLTLMQP